jgi:hypothetical protein
MFGGFGPTFPPLSSYVGGESYCQLQNKKNHTTLLIELYFRSILPG